MHHVGAVEEGDGEGGHGNPACYHKGHESEDKPTVDIGQLVEYYFYVPSPLRSTALAPDAVDKRVSIYYAMNYLPAYTVGARMLIFLVEEAERKATT